MTGVVALTFGFRAPRLGPVHVIYFSFLRGWQKSQATIGYMYRTHTAQ
jgi:hypothetical protein